jgi:hypothetical protein
VGLDRSTLCGWVDKGDALIDPLVAAVRRYVMANDKIHGDDTPVKVLAPGSGKTRTGRLWVYVRDDRPAGDASPRAAWFAYSPDRGGEHPQDHLRGFRGALQADAYAGWPKLYATGQVQEVACWAHARRPWWELFLDSKRAPDSLAAEALRRIRTLYDIEDEIRGQPPEVRRAQRQARAGPLLTALRKWLQELLPRVSAKSEIAQAIRYSLARWKALTRYVDDGRLEMDNNAAERALRGVSPRAQELPLHGLGCRRRAGGGLLQPGGDGQAQRAGSRGVPARGLHPHRRAPDQPHRRAAALEHRAAAHGARRPRQDGGMNVPGIDARLIELLQQASNLQLFQLNSVIERMLADPRRILQVRKDLHLGQTVRFMDWRDGQMRLGTVVAMKDTQLTIQEQATRSAWTVPYTAVEPPAPGACGLHPSRRRRRRRRAGSQRLPLRREGGLRGQAPEHGRGRHRAHQPAHGQHRPG